MIMHMGVYRAGLWYRLCDQDDATGSMAGEAHDVTCPDCIELLAGSGAL